MTIATGLADLGIRLRDYREGSSYKTLCPWCSHTRRNKSDPCLSVTIGPAQTHKGPLEAGAAVYGCHNCGEGGIVFEDQRRARHDAPRRTPKPAPRKPTFHADPATLTDAACAWWSKRGISRATLERNRITLTRHWMPKAQKEVSVWAFPYLRDGEVVNVKYRGPDKDFLQEKDAEKVFFGLDDLDSDAREIIIVEGEPDKLALNEAGLWNVLSVPDGAPKEARPEGTKIDPEDDAKFEYVWNCRAYLDRAERVILAVDADKPGQALEAELARRIGKEKCLRVVWPTLNDVERKDANEVLVEDGPEVLRECIERAQPYPIRSLFDVGQFESDVVALYAGQRKRGMPTGWANVDPLYTVRTGEWTVVTGYPGSGKSEWVDALCLNLAVRYGWTFALCSFENPPDEHIAKLAQKYVGRPFYDGADRRRMSQTELGHALDWLRSRFFFIRADDESPNIDWLLEKARAAVMRYGIKGLVIDPYNELEHKRPNGMSETEYVSETISKVRRFCAAHDVHCWFVAHPTKPMRIDGRYPIPSLYDISGGAHWHNKADAGIVIHRDWDSDRKRYSNVAQVHVRKVRFRIVGRPGQTELDYDPASGRYRDPTASEISNEGADLLGEGG